MIKKILLLSLFVFGIESKAQVGINTITPNAQLDVQSSNQATPSNTDGILIPKVDVFPATNPTVAQQGMLVYLTTSTTFSGNPKPLGFYYWNNTPPDWIPIGNNNNSGWSLTGNAGTNPVTNFIGTTDNRDIVLRRNNLVSGRIGTSNSSYGLNALFSNTTGFSNTANGVNALFSNTIGSSNTANGVNALQDNTTGFSNTANGVNALFSNTTGSSNTANGVTALFSNTTGFSNTANGVNALFRNTIGSSNTANGVTALFSNTTGFSNTANGVNALFSNTTGVSNTANGVNALQDNTTGFFNTANGVSALQNNTTGFNNTANGASALFSNTTGFNNTASGLSALFSNISGNSNSSFGYLADVTASNLFNATAIGARAEVGASNAMVLGSIIGVNSATASTSVGIGTTIPRGVLDVTSSINGVLIPRIALTSAIVQAPIVNPQGGALETSTLVYNSATAGVIPNNVYPGFYYWNGSRWIRFDANGENNPTYYTAVGTFDTISSSTFLTLPQMSITFTPKDDVVLVNFSAAGHRIDDSCPDTAIFFQIVLNGIPVTGWQTASKQSIVNSSLFNDDITTWDTNISYPVSVPIGIPQTIQIQWSAPDCQMRNHPATPLAAFGSVFRSYRTLTVIDPNGGGGIVGSPPVTTNLWALNGNTGTSALTNFVGTADNQPLRFRTANTFAGNISNTTGGLVSLGFNAGPVNSGFSNTFFGGTAGLLNTTGDSNTFIGQGAGASNTTTSSNTYVGTGAGQSNTTGSQNVYLGRLAGGNGATGSNNILIGNGAGISNQANQNSFVGSFSGNGNSTGVNNSFFGFSSGSSNGIGNQNTFVGAFAGNINTDGTLNTIIGCNANLSTNNLTNAAAIGTNALVSASNSLVLGSVNGVNSATSTVNVGIGTTAPLERLHVAGRTFLTNGFSADNAALVYRNNTDYMFLGPQSGSSANGAAMALFGTTNATGGNAGGVDFNVPNGQVRITSAGNVGIGATPARKFEVSNAGIVYGRITNTATTEVGFELKRLGSDWQMRNEAGLLLFGQSNDDLVTVADVLRLGGSSVTPAVDNGVTLGQLALRWTNVFAVNGTIQTSDANDKKEMKPITFGLDKIKQLRPISFQWKDNAIDNSATHLGFVAQEVQQVLPQVIVDSDWVELPEGQGRVWQKSERLGMKYAEIIPVLVKAVQEQQEVIENQKNEIKTLKQQLEQQQRAILERLEKLEATSKPD